ncbi:MAG: cellulase family glycosylhydrolase [Thermoguttaceae bacterium]
MNFLPSTAGNTTEFRQAESFDEKTLQRELGWARQTGFNSVRVFFQYLVWKHDPEGAKKRIDRFLGMAHGQGLSTMLVLLDDCSFGDPPLHEPFLGKQREPIPGMIASNWTPSPGLKAVSDQSVWPDLERYVKDVVGHFGTDGRIVMWDLYNEPGNSGMGSKSLPLVEAAFAWARQARPQQPLTVGVWNGGLADLNRRQLELSDIVSFHAYTNYEGLKKAIARYKAHKRPVVCTEWMARLLGSRWATDLPLFKQQRVGCYSWGLVNGRMQCQFPWWSKRGDPEPKVWFHDLLRPDGTPYDPAEIEVIRKVTTEAGHLLEKPD